MLSEIEEDLIGVRILVIEDDPNMQAVLKTLLESEDYSVEVTDSGDRAIELAALSHFDLIIADIRTEGRSGLDAIEEVQRQDPNVQSLVVTGYSSEEESIRAIRLGVKQYFKKPFALDEFLKSVEILAMESIRVRQERERFKTLEESLLWALNLASDGLSRAPDVQFPPGFAEVASLCRRLAGQLGLGEESVRAVQVACLVQTLNAYTVTEAVLTPYFQRVVDHIDEWWNGEGGPDGLAGEEIPVESRMAALVLTLTGKPELQQNLETLFPGRFDPTVLAAVERLRGGEDVTESATPTARRRLLRLAQTLEQSGNLISAYSAYKRLTTLEVAASEKVAALRGLARLSVEQGRPQQAKEYLLQASVETQALGPTGLAESSLEIGILLHKLGAHEGLEHILKAARIFKSSGHLDGLALSSWAADWAGRVVENEALEGYLERLAQPTNLAWLSSACGWLLPQLLRAGERMSQLRARVVVRLCRQSARGVRRLLLSGGLEESGRHTLAHLLHPDQGPEISGILEILSQHGDEDIRRVVRAKTPVGDLQKQPPSLRIHLMGPLEVWTGDSLVSESEWKTVKVRHLFAHLAYRRGKPVSEDILLEMLWPEATKGGKTSLYWACSVLRRILRPSGWDQLDYVPRNSGRLQLNPSVPRWTDVEELEDTVAAFRDVRVSSAAEIAPFRRIGELYRGPFLENCYLDWALGVRAKLELETAEALTRLCHLYLGFEEYPQAIDCAGSLLEIDECDQSAHLVLMKAFVNTGRPEAALRQFEKASARLAREHQMEPSTDLIEWKHRALLMVP